MVALALAVPAQDMPGLTAQQAQSLPLPDLATRVLGAAGEAMVKVDRPRWVECVGLCPIPTPADVAARRGPAPLSGLTFYQRPYAVSDMTSTWRGLCATTIVAVSFDAAGRVTSVGSGERYGVPSVAVPLDDGVRDFTERQALANRRCAEHWDMTSNFVAMDSAAAFNAALGWAILSHRRGGRPSRGTTVICDDGTDCANYGGRDAIADWIAPTRYRLVSQVTCDRARDQVRTYGAAACYKIDLMRDGESAMVDLVDLYSTARVTRVEYRQANVVY